MEKNGVEEYFPNFFVHQKIKGECESTDSGAPSLESDLIQNGRA